MQGLQPDQIYVKLLEQFVSLALNLHKLTLQLPKRYHKCQFKIKNAQLIGYFNADYAGDLDDGHSTSGNVFLMCNGALNWLSKKQPIVTLSTAEVEYVALSTATQEAVWLKKFLKDFEESQDQATKVMEDNCNDN